jgi:tellurite resistance protein TerC
LEAAVHRFVYLKHALSIVLIFIGIKIFLPHIGIELQTWHSLAVTFALLFGGVFISLFKEKEQKA